MNPKRIVTCLPVKNPQKTLAFYTDCFGVKGATLEEGIVTVEMANLDLFLIEVSEFEKYSKPAKLQAHFPHKNSQIILSCAVESQEEVEALFNNAEKCGGTIAQSMKENKWGQKTGYIQDPDGHLWEIVRV